MNDHIKASLYLMGAILIVAFNIFIAIITQGVSLIALIVVGFLVAVYMHILGGIRAARERRLRDARITEHFSGRTKP